MYAFKFCQRNFPSSHCHDAFLLQLTNQCQGRDHLSSVFKKSCLDRLSQNLWKDSTRGILMNYTTGHQYHTATSLVRKHLQAERCSEPRPAGCSVIASILHYFTWFDQWTCCLNQGSKIISQVSWYIAGLKLIPADTAGHGMHTWVLLLNHQRCSGVQKYGHPWFKCLLQWICMWSKANLNSKIWAKCETFLQILKQDCFLFTIVYCLSIIKKEKGPVQKFGNPFGLFFVTFWKRWLLRPRPRWFTCYGFNESMVNGE